MMQTDVSTFHYNLNLFNIDLNSDSIFKKLVELLDTSKSSGIDKI